MAKEMYVFCDEWEECEVGEYLRGIPKGWKQWLPGFLVTHRLKDPMPIGEWMSKEPDNSSPPYMTLEEMVWEVRHLAQGDKVIEIWKRVK